jgi:heterodisulfide reductase subunit C
MNIVLSKGKAKLAGDLQALTGVNPMLCYQCQKCTLGCPSAYAMRMKPHEMMRAIQLGFVEEIYWSGTIWICLSCETCNTRCPQAIDILRLINGLREMAKGMEHYNPHPAIPTMNRIFMALANRFGRIHELGLTLLTHALMMTPFQDIDLASPMLMKRKFRLLPSRSRGVRELRKVTSRIEEAEQREWMK